MTLATANAYSGGTFLSGGQLNINNAAAIGTGLLTISGSPTIDNTSNSAITLVTNNAQAWNSNFTFNGSNALNMGTGAVTLGTNVTVTVNGATTAPLTIGGIISGAHALSVQGTGTLTLNGANLFTGGVTLNNGALLNLGTATALGTGTFTINGGSFNNTSGAAITLANPQTWNGNFTFVGSNAISASSSVTVTLGNNIVVTLNGAAATGARTPRRSAAFTRDRLSWALALQQAILLSQVEHSA